MLATLKRIWYMRYGSGIWFVTQQYSTPVAWDPALSVIVKIPGEI